MRTRSFESPDVETFRREFSKRLRIRMIEADMDPFQLSRASGACIDSVREYMRGGATPMLHTAWKMARALGCSLDELCMRADAR